MKKGKLFNLSYFFLIRRSLLFDTIEQAEQEVTPALSNSVDQEAHIAEVIKVSFFHFSLILNQDHKGLFYIKAFLMLF